MAGDGLDEQAKAIGARVRYWRLKRRFERKPFADMVGRSVSWLDKIEKGDRSLLRLPQLERVAEVLGVSPAALTEGPASGRASQCVDPAEVRAIHAALGSYPALNVVGAGQPATVAAISRQAKYLDLAWTSSRFTVVAQHLPALIRDAQHASLVASEVDQLVIYRVLVTAYRLASSMLLKFESNHIAWLAADRAMNTAMKIDDTWSLARATRSVARSMTSSGQRPEAISVLLGMADRMRPKLAVDAVNLQALYGMLFLAASITAAEEDDADLSRSMYEEASGAAAGLMPDHQTHNTFFGPTNVEIHRVAALVRLREGRAALAHAETINPADIGRLSAERQANYLLDMTEAYALIGKYGKAVESLGNAERAAPEEVRCRPLAHGLLRSLLSNTNGEHGRIVRAMSERAGVTV